MAIKTNGALTRLDALNTIATYLGIPPLVNITEVDADPDFRLIDAILEEASLTIQAQGMPCNRDFEYPLSPDQDGEIVIPEGSLLTDPAYYWDNRYVEREGKLYDTRNHTFNISRTVKVDLIWMLEFDALPQVVKRHIIIVASRMTVARLKGEDSLTQKTAVDESRTLTEFQRYINRVGDYNMQNSPDVAFIANRDFNMTRY